MFQILLLFVLVGSKEILNNPVSEGLSFPHVPAMSFDMSGSIDVMIESYSIHTDILSVMISQQMSGAFDSLPVLLSTDIYSTPVPMPIAFPMPESTPMSLSFLFPNGPNLSYDPLSISGSNELILLTVHYSQAMSGEFESMTMLSHSSALSMPVPSPIQAPVPVPVPHPMPVPMPVSLPIPMPVPFPVPLPIPVPMPQSFSFPDGLSLSFDQVSVHYSQAMSGEFDSMHALSHASSSSPGPQSFSFPDGSLLSYDIVSASTGEGSYELSFPSVHYSQAMSGEFEPFPMMSHSTALSMPVPMPVPAPNPVPVPGAPTVVPTAVPTDAPTAHPSVAPTAQPSATPTSLSPTVQPSVSPSAAPTAVPSVQPSTLKPTVAPTPSAPTLPPTRFPSARPTVAPSVAPGEPTLAPTATTAPTVRPTAAPSTGTAIAISFF